VLSSEVKVMNQKVQTQGSSIERLGVALSEVKKIPRPVRRFVLPDVEEYSDFDELLSMFGYGRPVMSDYTAFAATAGVKLSEMKKGALMMLNVRARVKGSSFAEVATATTTKAFFQHPDDDFEIIIEEKMDEHKMEDKEAYTHLKSWIAGPEARPKTLKQLAAEKKREEAYKNKHGKDKTKPSTPDKRRAYQPVMQTISHMYEAIKWPVVAAWFNAVERKEPTMQPAEATEWPTDVHSRKKPEEPGQAHFMASAKCRPAMKVAMHAMYIRLGAADRIRAPKHCRDVEVACGTVGHYALAVIFIRNALAKVSSGQRRRSGFDNGLSDLWRVEFEGVKPLSPSKTTPWHGLVFTDGTNPQRSTFEVAPVPLVGRRGHGRLPLAPNDAHAGRSGGASSSGGGASGGTETGGGSGSGGTCGDNGANCCSGAGAASTSDGVNADAGGSPPGSARVSDGGLEMGDGVTAGGGTTGGSSIVVGNSEVGGVVINPVAPGCATGGDNIT